MTNEQINIAIAYECEWKFEQTEEGGKITYPSGFAAEFSPISWAEEKFLKTIPDFCNDLNAIREAMELISQQCKESDYWFFLRQIIGFPDAESDWDELYYFQAVNATARHRAEAFLKTLGKWEQ